MRNALWTRKAAGLLARSRWLRRGQGLWERNQNDWNLPLSKWDKLITGVYLILIDYSRGQFPPRFPDRQETHDGEIAYGDSLPGVPRERVLLTQMKKPFWFGRALRDYFTDFTRIIEAFEQRGIRPPKRILEIGCGAGWMAEFLATSGFGVVATTIDPQSIDQAEKRRRSLECKGLEADLTFRTSAMEYVSGAVADLGPFDAAFVYEALHHAHDWEQACESVYRCLVPGGWFFVLNEPNLVHTLVSYRVGRLSNTHEVGLNPARVISVLRRTGFGRVDRLRNRLHFWARPVWLAARKTR